MLRLRRRAQQGDPEAASNLAAEYRILKRPRLAFRWWSIAVDRLANGDDLLELAYCLHHGIGVRRNLARARDLYEQALRNINTTAFAHEETRYHLATMLLHEGASQRRRAVRLLGAASADGDYPQAAELLAVLLGTSGIPDICHCRRALSPSLGGRSKCKLHG